MLLVQDCLYRAGKSFRIVQCGIWEFFNKIEAFPKAACLTQARLMFLSILIELKRFGVESSTRLNSS